MNILTVIPVVFPIIASLFLMSSRTEDTSRIHRAALSCVIINATAVWAVILLAGEGTLQIARFTDDFVLCLRVDGMSKLFAGMVSVLWIFTTVYAFEYMKHEGMEKKFFGFFLMSFGVVMGVAFAGNLFTLYMFYEYLTFATLPLVMHQMSKKSRYAGKVYLIYSISGGAAVFVGMMFLVRQSVPLDFTMGGLGAYSGDGVSVIRWVFLVLLAGFGVKAAIFPLYYWLPTASVAPTPVTALLHAVAVVKSGVFAIARVTYFVIGTEVLAGSFAQDVMLLAASFTIVFGSAMALRTPHLKRRLAYSTVSNLSYIVLGLAVMSSRALTGAMLHILFHGVIKITLFFCAGAILVRTGAEYIDQLHGYGKRMPVVMACFTICGLSLTGIPPFAAFTSKYYMATAALALSSPVGPVGVAALLISEVLTVIYIFQPVMAAYFPKDDMIISEGPQGDPGRQMTVPITVLTVMALLLAACSGPIANLVTSLL